MTACSRQASQMREVLPRTQDDEGCLVGDVFRNGSAFLYRNAEAAVQQRKISDKPRKHNLNITGSVLGFPIYVRGHMACVVTIWRKGGENEALGWSQVELFRRAGHLLANVRRTDDSLYIKDRLSAPQ